jgi:hypothetical protein
MTETDDAGTDRAALAVARYQAGESILQVAGALSWTFHGVREALIAAGVERRGRGGMVGRRWKQRPADQR